MQLALLESAGVSTENDEWYTPSWLFEALAVEFDLDPCSPGAPPSTVPAKHHLTKAENGLAADWVGSVWLNPPFSSKREWYERLIAHGDGVALMPARTETHDFQDYMSAADALLFLKGRIYFERGSRPGANGNGHTTTPPFGIVLCAYGDRMASALLASGLQGVRARVIHAGESDDVEYYRRLEFKARGKIASFCDGASKLIHAIDEIEKTTDRRSELLRDVAKKLRTAVMLATD